MNDAVATPAPSPVAGYVSQIVAHLVRLEQGHDRRGHLLAVERLARAARAEVSATARQTDARSS